MNIALLGPGRIADRWLAPAVAAAKDVQLWSVLSRDLERAREFAERHGAKSAHPAHTELLTLLADPGLDAVLIATPDALHAQQAIAAVRAGKHVLVEKPMATDRDEGRAMVNEARSHRVTLAIAYHLRWHAGHRRMVERIRQGALGDLRHMRAQWTYKAADASNWRAGKDVGRWWGLAGVGTHCLDFVRWIMKPTCGEVVEVRSVIGRPVWKGPNDENAVVALRFANDATAEIVTSVTYDSVTSVDVYGSIGSASCRGTFGPHGAGEVTILGDPLSFPVVNPYVGEIEDFAAAVRDHRDPEVGGEEGFRNVEILLEAAPRG